MAKIKGVRAVRAALKKAPPELRKQVGEVVESAVKSVHTQAKANLSAWIGTSPRATVTVSGKQEPRRLLRRLYRMSVSKSALNGRVGYLSKETRAKAYYARFVHDGTAHSASHPFHQNAVDAVKPDFNADARSALKSALDKTLPK